MSRSMYDVLTEVANWDNIADELVKRGIKGDRDLSCSCPLANYLIRETDPAEVSVVWVDDPIQWVDREGNRHAYSMTDYMGTFIQDFDNGEYPELDTNPVDPEDDWDDCDCDGCVEQEWNI